MKSFPLVLVAILSYDKVYSGTMESCDSLVYCQGDLLDTVQRAKLFKDSKTFVDMMQINPSATTLENFERLKKKTNSPTRDDVRRFVEDNFLEQGELDFWSPGDYKSDPEFLQKIDDVLVKEFARNLVAIWPTLGRKVRSNVAANPDRHSLIPVPKGFIVPGGRFRELYYWDSYWVIKGLLISKMRNTVRGMLENLLSFVVRYGFVPNGGRVYYLNRSQPPLLTLMVGLYVDATNDTKWLRRNVGVLERELRWWLMNRTVTVEKNGVKYSLAHYGSDSGTPRPESYSEDVRTCARFKEHNGKENCYKDLKGAAESGWDFSSRWIFDPQGGTNSSITDTQTRRVIPVDLNAYLCKAFQELSRFYRKLGKRTKSVRWRKKAGTWKKTIELVFYDKEDGIWYDFDMKLSQPRKIFYPSNFAPLWTESYPLLSGKHYGKRAANYFKNQGLNIYRGGIPTSLIKSKEQWDFPNAWAPMQEIVILGLRRSGDRDAKHLAKSLAKRWIDSNIRGYNQSKVMFEKYDAINSGQYGGGGEYVVQNGFGWTNGVALSLINEYYVDNSLYRKAKDIIVKS